MPVAPRDTAIERPTRARYAVLVLLALVAAIAYLERQLIAVVAEPLAADLALTKSQLGTVMAAFFVGYALFQIPSGWLADRWGSRRALGALAVTWSLAAGAMAIAQGYATALALWFVAGSAQAGAFPCAASSLRKWMPPTRRALASGILASCMSLGGALSAFLAGSLAGVLDWRQLFILFALPGLAWGGLFYWWFRDTPEQHAGTNEAERRLIRDDPAPAAPREQPRAAQATPWRAMLTSGSLWAICGQQFFRAAAYVFFATWFPTYLSESHGVAVDEAGRLTSLPLVAVVLGAPLGGIASDRLLARTHSRRISRCALSAVSLLLCAALILIAYFVADAGSAVLVIAAGSFCAAFGGVSAYTITMDLGGARVATVFSVMNMCGNLGAALSPPLVGWLVETSGNWDLVLPFFAAVYAAAAACWMLLDPQRKIFADTPATEPTGS